MSREQEALPYWLVNVPANQRPTECPDFLADANEKDKQILATPDSDYCRLSWPEVQDLIRKNRIDLFQRVPSDLRRYKGYTAKLKKEHGSVVSFVLSERLRWQDLVPRGEPFSNPGEKITIETCFAVNTRSRRYQNPVQRLALWYRHKNRASRCLGQISVRRRSCYRRFDRFGQKTSRLVC